MVQPSPLFRILGEQSPRIEHRHVDRWIRMERTIPVLTDRVPRSFRGSWRCPTCNEVVLHEWRAPLGRG